MNFNLFNGNAVKFLLGTNIATVGDTAVFLYIVYRGSVLAWCLENEKFRVLGGYNAGESFGKHGVLIYDQFYTKVKTRII